MGTAASIPRMDLSKHRRPSASIGSREKGLAPEVASQIKDLFTDDPADIVGSYRKLATWAETHDLPTYKVINAVFY